MGERGKGMREKRMNAERDIQEVFAALRKDPELAQELDSYALLSRLVLEVVEERVSQGLTQEDLARRLGTKQSAISRFENMGRKPGLDFLERLAQALGGKLFATIHGQYATLVPRKYWKFIDELAREQGVAPERIVQELLVETIERKMRRAEKEITVRVVAKHPIAYRQGEMELPEECRETLAS